MLLICLRIKALKPENMIHLDETILVRKLVENYLRICRRCDAKWSSRNRARVDPRSRKVPKVAVQTFGQCVFSPGTAENPEIPGNVRKIRRPVANEAKRPLKWAHLPQDRIQRRWD